MYPDKTKYALWIAVIVLFLVVLLQRQCNVIPAPPEPTIIRDTVWRDTGSVVYLKPEPVHSEPGPIPSGYQPDSNCDTLKTQYIQLAKTHFTRNYYRDSFSFDSSKVLITDTVSGNKITGRSVDFRIKYPVVKETITNSSRRQVYLGGGIGGNKQEFINQFRLGILYKDRRDRVFILNGNLINGQLGADVSSYWKIRLK